MIRRAGTALLVAPAVLAAAALAHVRFMNPGNGAKLHWSSPSLIRIVISSAGSDDLGNGLHFPALRSAIAAWNDLAGTTGELVEDATPAQQARTDWQADGLHQILFDETNSSSYFPAGSGIVALTPVWFAGDGRITDADILFNGSGFSFTTSREPGRFDVQDVGAHEIGHLLGLDHSGWAGATMYPYVDPTVVLHRSLSRDEERGMRDAYPSGSFASIQGTVRRQSDGSTVAGAHVVARDTAGRTEAGALANRLGVFQLLGLDAGTYTVYATPLDYPVSSANLATGNTVHVDFESTVFGSFTVGAGQTLAVGDQSVSANVAISLGRSGDPYPLRCIEGQTQGHSVRGAGLAAGSTLTPSDPALTVVPIAWMNTAVAFQVTVPPGATPGHVDLTATNPAGQRSILPAALEITPPGPVVTDVQPATGSSNGGTPVTITGSGFRAGARVVVGRNVYPDGEPGGCTVVDPTTIQLVTLATPDGSCDVVVIDPTGVEGRRPDAFLFATIPVITSVFPAAGSASGGTVVVIGGTGFVPGSTVSIGGAPQGQVTFADSAQITIVTEPGVVGGPYTLSVQNPGGASSSASFSFVADADPSLLSVAPLRGGTGGGDSVIVQGSNLPPDAVVVFGADPVAGSGGTPAASVTWIDAGTLEVVTPAHAQGSVAVLVSAPSTGQAALLSEAFTFASPGGGGGGGCSIAPVDSSRSSLEPLAGGLWLLVLAAILSLRSRRGAATSRAT